MKQDNAESETEIKITRIIGEIATKGMLIVTTGLDFLDVRPEVFSEGELIYTEESGCDGRTKVSQMKWQWQKNKKANKK